MLTTSNVMRQASHESSIYAFETSYLSIDLSAGSSNTTFGNIVRGYDAYLKASGSSSHTDSSRKKGGSSSSTRGGYTTGMVGPGGSLLQPVAEEDRIFSRSSLTYQDSLQLRDRDAGVVTASEGEEEDDQAQPGSARPDGAGGQREAKRPKRR